MRMRGQQYLISISKPSVETVSRPESPARCFTISQIKDPARKSLTSIDKLRDAFGIGIEIRR